MSRALLPILALALVAVPRLADACSCVLTSACQVFARADAVIGAEVIDVSQDGSAKRSRMRVVRSYKGSAKVGDEVIVRMPRGDSGSCSLDVRPGDRYVIHAEAGADGLSTSLCQGSHPLSPGASWPDLPPPGGVFKGKLVRPTQRGVRLDERPIAGAPLWIVTPHGRITGTTGDDGTFRLEGVPPGNWTVHFDVGPGERAEAEISLSSADDCAERYISTQPAGVQ